MRIGAGGTSVKCKRAAGIVFTDGKAILLLKRTGDCDHTGTWAPPGGKNKEGETDIGAATRESMEEAGLDSVPGYRFNSLISKNGKQKFTTYFYHVNKPFDVNVSHEHSESKWVNISELPSMNLHPKFKDSLPECLQIVRKKIHNFNEWSAITDLMMTLADGFDLRANP